VRFVRVSDGRELERASFLLDRPRIGCSPPRGGAAGRVVGGGAVIAPVASPTSRSCPFPINNAGDVNFPVAQLARARGHTEGQRLGRVFFRPQWTVRSRGFPVRVSRPQGLTRAGEVLPEDFLYLQGNDRGTRGAGGVSRPRTPTAVHRQGGRSEPRARRSPRRSCCAAATPGRSRRELFRRRSKGDRIEPVPGSSTTADLWIESASDDGIGVCGAAVYTTRPATPAAPIRSRVEGFSFFRRASSLAGYRSRPNEIPHAWRPAAPGGASRCSKKKKLPGGSACWRGRRMSRRRATRHVVYRGGPRGRASV
jgi:hypothetical protein